jgi:glycine cleavage system T protein (aminomethyltransferase)
METPLIELHRAAGIRLAETGGCALPESFSSLESEYAAAKQRVALFDTGWHATLKLTGRDRVRYLHAITSNNIQALGIGEGTLALLLNPQGHVLSELEIYVLAESVLARTHVSARERTVATLKKFIIGSDVKVEDATDTTGSLAIEGPLAGRAVEPLCGVKIEDLATMAIRDVEIEGIACQLIRRSHFGLPGAEFIAARADLARLWRKVLAAARAEGGQPIGMNALHTLHLEAGVPWYPADFNEAMIPHEAAVEATHISFNKGCYTGQEIVERVRSRGHVNRRRVSLKFSTIEPPPAGTKLRASGGSAEIGFITSAARSPNAQPAIGMGYVRREQLAPGSVVEFDGGTATVTG